MYHMYHHMNLNMDDLQFLELMTHNPAEMIYIKTLGYRKIKQRDKCHLYFFHFLAAPLLCIST